MLLAIQSTIGLSCNPLKKSGYDPNILYLRLKRYQPCYTQILLIKNQYFEKMGPLLDHLYLSKTKIIIVSTTYQQIHVITFSKNQRTTTKFSIFKHII